MNTEADYLINRHKNCGHDNDHDHDHNHDHNHHDHDHDHNQNTHKTVEKKDDEEFRSYKQMDKPKIPIEKLIYLTMFLHLPFSLIVSNLKDTLGDEERRLSFQERLDNIPSPFESRRLIFYLGKSFLINFFDILVIMYLFRPIAKFNKSVIL
jgi:hypothetical protein